MMPQFQLLIIHIADCRLPIADFQISTKVIAIFLTPGVAANLSNRQLAIGNWQCE